MLRVSEQCNWDFCLNRFHVGADGLYWKMQEESLKAASFIDDFPNPVFKSVKTYTVEPHFNYESGFRLYAGYAMPCNVWNV